MGTREKQNLLTVIIIVSVISIIVILAYIIYPEMVKKQINNNITESTNTTSTTEITQTTQTTETTQSESTDNNYIGEEELNSENDVTEDATKSKEERAIELAKEEWGEADETVTYTIEQKDGDIYYISVKRDTQVQQWYEVDTENWTISQY